MKRTSSRMKASTTEQQQQQQQQQQETSMSNTSGLLASSPNQPKYDGTTTTTNNNNNSNRPPAVPKSPMLVRTLSRLSGGSADPHATPHDLVGILLITLGSFSFSCMFLFVKLMQGKANSFTLGFYRALVEIPIALWLCHEEQTHPLGPAAARGWLWVRGGMGAAAVLCFFYAIQHLPLPDAVTLQFTTPPFAAGFAVVLARERYLKLDMMGAVVCLAGVMLIAHPSWLFGSYYGAGGSSAATNGDAADGDNDDKPPQDVGAVAVALLGAAFAGLAYTSVRMIGHGASANVMTLYYSVLSLPVTLIGSRLLLNQWNVWGQGYSAFSGWDWCWMLCTGLTAYAGQYLTNLGLQHETAATGTLATCSQIVFTYIFELLFLHEPANVWSMAGTVLIVGFMVIVGMLKMKEADQSIHEVTAGEPEGLALLFSAERDIVGRRNNNEEQSTFLSAA